MAVTRHHAASVDRVLLDLPELVAVTEDEVHVFVEGLEGADEDAAVLQDAPHPEVDVLQHLAALSHRLHTHTMIPLVNIGLHEKSRTSFPIMQCIQDV